MTADPFGTAALRASVLRAWKDSPTRFTEDTNAEHDLKVGGYRDRLFVELAQNAADAAALAGTPGAVRVSLVDNELLVANTGAPLDAAGVGSLASLRASAKPSGGMVGRFGVGFAAVLTVSTAPRVVSTSGGVAFSDARTREAAWRNGDVPVLRLPWPVTETEPSLPEGFDTEVRLPLVSGVDGRRLLEQLAGEAPDLLLALRWLARIEVGDAAWTRSEDGDVVTIGLPDGTVRRWLTHRGWAVPVTGDGVPEPLGEDVLRAPTPTDERLSLPARLIASVPTEPTRRRARAGEDLTSALRAAAADYPELVRKVEGPHRIALVPTAGFPVSDVDGSLRELVLARLAESDWLPAAEGPDLSPARARILAVDAPELVEPLRGIVPGLTASPLCGPTVARTLAPLGVTELSVAEVAEALVGTGREPSWWLTVYDALLSLVDSEAARADELGVLPVPLADGRTLPGPRGALMVGGSEELIELLSDVDIAGLRLVHPDAVHPLLERLGAGRADAGELLDAPALREAVERSVEDVRSGLDGMALAGAVLRLVHESGEGPDRGWLAALAMPAADGWRRASELVLPSSPLRRVFAEEVFAEDGPLSVLDEDFAEDWPDSALVAVGVLDGFAVVVEDEPAEPDHDLDAEEAWWDSLPKPPERIEAVRDLDLVSPDAWPAALELLAARPETWRALALAGGHTPWWLARYAELSGRHPRHWRLPDADELTGLFDPVPDTGLSTKVLRATGVRTGLSVSDVDDVRDLLDRLGDPDREVAPGLTLRVHGALAAAPELWGDIPAPERVRTLDGSTVDAADAWVLDVPWPAAVLPAGRLVGIAGTAGTSEGADRLAELLDLPSASEIVATVGSAAEGDEGDGEYVPWAELAAVRLAAELIGADLPPGGPIVHERLTVALDGTAHDVPWWSDGRLHAADTSEGLARAFAWAAGRWPDRHLLTALLDDPAPTTLLG